MEPKQPFSTLLEILKYRAEVQSDQLAYVFLNNGETESDRLTYGQLWQKAKHIATALPAAPGDRALLLYPPGLEFVTAFLGCLLAGVVAVPAYPPRRNQKLSRLQAMVEDAGTQLALTTSQFLANREFSAADEAMWTQLTWLATDSDPLPQQSEVLPLITPAALALLQYTSGATGRPKGVMVNHHNLMQNEAVVTQILNVHERSILFGWLPFFHDLGLIGNILQPLYRGIPSILMSPLAFIQKPVRWLQGITRYQATISGGPNFAYDFCVEKIKPDQLAGLDLSSWQVAGNAAESVRAKTLQDFSDKFAPYGFNPRAFHPCYGMAETTLIATGKPPQTAPVIKYFDKAALEQNRVVEIPCPPSGVERGQPAHCLVSCGTPQLGHQVVIVEPETQSQVKPGTVGEIWLAGESIAQGYWQSDDPSFSATLADIGAGPFYRTGDLGFLWEGELFVTGRLKEMIIIRGQNYYPQDIELTVQQSHPALKQNAGVAFMLEMADKEELMIVQEVKRSEFKNCDRATVFRAINQAVFHHHGLDIHTTLLVKPGAVPKTSSGKIQRRACRQRFLAGQLDGSVVERWAKKIADS